MTKPLHLLGISAAMSALLIFAADEASAQRGGRGGGRTGASASARPSSSANRQVRSSAGSTMKSTSRQTSNVNRTASRSGNRVNTGNINTGDVNINVDVNNGWGAGYHPVARATAYAATTAVVMGAYYNALPGGCAPYPRAGLTYYQCGAYWYQPVYSGANVQYVVVQAP